MFFVTKIYCWYGKRTGETTKKLLKTAVKMARMKNKLKFLLNCRRCKIVPKCIDYKIPVMVQNPVSVHEIKQLEKKQKIRMLSVVISDTKRTMEVLKKNKRYLLDKVNESMGETEGKKVQKMVENSARNAYTVSRTRGTRKMERLKKLKILETVTKPEWIENTTDFAIPDFLERTLLLGPNFNIQNDRAIPYVRFVADVETAIREKPDADGARAEVSTMVSNYLNYKKQPHTKHNGWIHQDITNSQKFLRDHPEIVIVKADKGNKTVVISANEYREKMQALVSDTNTYRQIRENPTNRVLKKLNTIIEQWWRDDHIDSHTKNQLKMFNCNPPRIYGLPKIHKQGRPLRPVVSTIGSATYRMARYLAKILNNTVGKTEYHVRNSFDFAQAISKVHVPENSILYSLDVVSLYTNTPVDTIVECVEERWNEIRRYTSIPWGSFKQAMVTVLESSFFQYDGKFYEQFFGVPMGSPLSPVGANIVMEKLEKETMRKLREKNVHLVWYQRYVDDCLVVGDESDIAAVLGEFNNFHEKLQFTLEKESETKLRFLDLTLERKGEKISKSWYPKQKSGRYLDFNSESPFVHKKNTAIALMDRALALSDVEKREDSLCTVRDILRSNNYPLCFIQPLQKQRVDKLYNSLRNDGREKEPKTQYASLPYIPGLSEKVGKVLRKHAIVAASKPVNKIKDVVFTKLKDKIPKSQQTNVVYSIPCGGCDMEYVGQTSQLLEKRLKQHHHSIRSSTSTTGLSQHALERGHRFDFTRTSVLEKIDKEKNRCTAEVLHIKLRENTAVNLQRDSASFSNMYTGILEKLRATQYTNTNRASETGGADTGSCILNSEVCD